MYIEKPDNISQEDWSEAWDDFNRGGKVKYEEQELIISKLGYDTKAIYENQPHKNLLAPNGITYDTCDDFHKGYGCQPFYKKDGVWYGMYELINKHNVPNEIIVSEKTKRTFGWFDTDLGI